MKQKKRSIRLLFGFVIVCFLFFTLCTWIPAEEISLITTRSDFINALNEAEDGAILLVSDIDFNLPSTGAVNEAERIILEKNITIKNGKKGENAVFKGASFLLAGSMIAGENTTFCFEGITFDEGLDTSVLTDADWQLSYDSLGEPISFYPLKNQYAIECKGNTTASFENCNFQNYMHTYGAAIRAFYADYTLTPSLEAEHGDNVPCQLNIILNHCNFYSNAALYGGGAIYAEAANKNVTIHGDGCSFIGNKSGFTEHSVGGGAVYLNGAVASFEDCAFRENDANYFYGGTRFDYDQLIGGAIGCSNKAYLSVKNTVIAGNKASEGGGIALVMNSSGVIENCIIRENKAIPETEDKQSSLGLCSNRGLGGALYFNGVPKVTVLNSEIYGNYAENVFGAIFAYYDLLNDYSTNNVELLFCTIANNICGTEMTEYMGYGEDRWCWFSYPTDFFDISYLNPYGNLVIDDVYDFVIYPSLENGYNYFANSAMAKADGYEVAFSPEDYEPHPMRNSPVVPEELTDSILGEREHYGQFTVGANISTVTYTFTAGDEKSELVSCISTGSPTMPDIHKPGYTIAGWNLKDGSEFDPTVPRIVGNGTSVIELYAVFIPNTYKVTFDFGSTRTEVTQTFDSPITFPAAEERKGFRFKGWYVSAEGEGEPLVSGELFTIPSDTTFYAVYEKTFPVWAVVTAAVAALITATGIGLFFFLKKKRKTELADNPVPVEGTEPVLEAFVQAETKIVKTRYTDDEIDQIIYGIEETHLLTARELDVFREILKGKKQSEIGYYLGISVSTVKDNAGRIYSKLGVANKSELFERIDNKLKK